MSVVALAVVTGAGNGIGRAIALAFARRGFDLALMGRTETTLCATAAQAQTAGVRTLVAVGDVAQERDVGRVVADVEAELGVPEVVVHNAGIVGRKAAIEATDPSDWDEVIGTNLRGPFLLTRAVLPAMRAAGRGRFVAIASISATLGSPGLAAYCASKWGVVGFIKSLAEELRGSGLQAMTVLPGTVDTPMARVGGFTPQMSPDEVARVVVFAALDAPDAMTGSSIECFG